jgi:hypothetical protein
VVRLQQVLEECFFVASPILHTGSPSFIAGLVKLEIKPTHHPDAYTLPRSVHTVAAARAASEMFDAMRTTLRGAWPTRVEELETVANN